MKTQTLLIILFLFITSSWVSGHYGINEIPRGRSEVEPVLAQLPSSVRKVVEIQSLAELENNFTVLSNQTNPLLKAALAMTLAEMLFTSSESNRSDNIEKAIRYYRTALQVINQDHYPYQWATILNNLAIACLDRSLGNQIKNVEAAILCLRKAQQVWTRRKYPFQWALLKNNLATAYLERHESRDKEFSIILAIECCQEALTIRTRRKCPEKWALTQYNLGTACLHRSRGDGADNVENAIKHFKKALEIQIEEKFPENWAMIHFNLGQAFAHRKSADFSNNIEMAIQHYQKALKYYTRERQLQQWGAILLNLSDLYLARPRGKSAENIDLAIDYLKQALEAFPKQNNLKEWAIVIKNLAEAYEKRLNDDREKNLDIAIQYYQEALEGLRQPSAPVQWATIQNNLAGIFLQRKHGNLIKNQEKAIHHYLAAEEVFSRENYPEQWASIQSSLARIYASKMKGDRKHNVETASWLFERALEVCTPQNSPLEYQRTLRHIAKLYFNNQQWDKALENYLELEQNLDQDIVQKAPVEIKNIQLKRVQEIFENGAFCFGQLNEPLQALVFLEKEKQFISQSNALVDNLYLQPATFAATCAEVFQSLEMVLIEMAITEQGAMLFLYNQKFPDQVKTLHLHALTRPLLHDLMFKEKHGYLSQYYLNKDNWYKDIQDHLSYIGELFWQELHPVFQDHQVRKLIIIPHNYLSIIPLQATPFYDSAVGRRVFPIEYYEMVFAPSADSYFKIVSAESDVNSTPEALFVENPEGDLAYSLSEIINLPELVDQYNYQLKTIKNDRVTQQALEKWLPQVHLFHYYGHGIFDPMHTSRSGFYLAPRDGQEELFTINDLNQKIFFQNNPLIILSACETGMADFLNYQGNSLGSLPQAFLEVGSKTVIASLWEVPNLATSILFIKFYDELFRHKQTPIMALRQAQMWLKSATRAQLEAYLRQMVSAPRLARFQEDLHNYGLEQRDKYVFLGLKNMVKELNIGAEPDKCPFAHPINWAGFYVTGAGFQPLVEKGNGN